MNSNLSRFTVSVILGTGLVFVSGCGGYKFKDLPAATASTVGAVTKSDTGTSPQTTDTPDTTKTPDTAKTPCDQANQPETSNPPAGGPAMCAYGMTSDGVTYSCKARSQMVFYKGMISLPTLWTVYKDNRCRERYENGGIALRTTLDQQSGTLPTVASFLQATLPHVTQTVSGCTDIGHGDLYTKETLPDQWDRGSGTCVYLSSVGCEYQ